MQSLNYVDSDDDEEFGECADTAPLLEALQTGLSENLTDLEKVVTMLSGTLPLLCQNTLQVFQVIEAREQDYTRQRQAMLAKITRLQTKVKQLKSCTTGTVVNEIKQQQRQQGFQENSRVHKEKQDEQEEYSSFFENNEEKQPQNESILQERSQQSQVKSQKVEEIIEIQSSSDTKPKNQNSMAAQFIQKSSSAWMSKGLPNQSKKQQRSNKKNNIPVTRKQTKVQESVQIQPDNVEMVDEQHKEIPKDNEQKDDKPNFKRNTSSNISHLYNNDMYVDSTELLNIRQNIRDQRQQKEVVNLIDEDQIALLNGSENSKNQAEQRQSDLSAPRTSPQGTKSTESCSKESPKKQEAQKTKQSKALAFFENQDENSRDKDNNYKFREVVRDKEQRRNLKGQACFRCEKFYQALDLECAEDICNECSRHRDDMPIQNTPEKFYDLDA